MKLKPKEYKTLWQNFKQERMDAFVPLHYNAINSPDDRVAQILAERERIQLSEMDKRDGTKEFESLLYTLERGSKK